MALLTPFSDWPWRYWAQQQADTPALLTETGDLTWSALSNDIDRLAQYFAAQGLKQGDGLVLRGKNSVEFLLLQLAAISSGARVLPLNPTLPIDILDALLPHLNIDFVIELDCKTQLLMNYPTLSYHDVTQFIAKEPFDSVVDFTRPATLILTSGSTGLPKAAVHTLEAHLASANGVLSLLDFQSTDSWLLSLPLFHVSGQGIIWRWLLQGAGLAIKPTQPLAIALTGVTHASLVPTQLWRLLEQQQLQDCSLTDVLLGGAMIPTELTDLAEAQGIRCWSGYGMTEMASTVCAKRADGKAGVGLPLAGKKIRLQHQEVQISSDSQALGYWFDGEIKPLNLQDGWFATNDKGAFIDGEYCILGRLDNLFFSGGEGIQPEDIEKVINMHPQVQQSFIIPITDVEFGQRPVAVIEVSESALAELKLWLKTKLATFQYPVSFYLLTDELKQGGIKVSRERVKQWVQKQQSS